MSVDYSKLKTNLNLIMHRLKLVEKKKVELNQKARRTIGEYLNAGKPDRARIRVEQIIREDYLIEAMDLVESYCDLLLSRFGQLQASEVVEDGLSTAVSSLIWVTPRFESDLPELKVIAEQLSRKYGKQYVLAVRDNSLRTVNETLIKKMGIQAPPKVLVEKYLVEIAKDQKIDYKPNPHVLKEQEALASSGYGGGTSRTSEDDNDHNRTGGRREPPTAAGYNLINLGDHYPSDTSSTFNSSHQPPPLPSEPPTGGLFNASLLDMDNLDVTDATAPPPEFQPPFNIDNPANTSSSSSSSKSRYDKSSASRRESAEAAQANSAEGPPPNYDSVVNRLGNSSQYFSFGPDSSFTPHQRSSDRLNDTLPELPPVPIDMGSNDSSSTGLADERLDFEDLTRRFEELKSKKN